MPNDCVDAKTFNQVSQMSHIAGGLALVFGAQVLFGSYIIATVIFLLLAAIKEFWYDYKFETEIVRGSSLMDFVFYTVGVAIAIVAIIIKQHV
jgi:hypothetical protein